MPKMRMVYVSPGPLEPRAVDGLTEFAKTWPGEIVVATSYGERRYDTFDVVSTHDIAAGVRRLRPSVITAIHRPQYAYLTDIGPTVYTAEYSRRIRIESQNVDNRNLASRARIAIGAWRQERWYRDMARHAAGLQCNGHAAWEAYGRLSPHAMHFREHRIRAADLERAKRRAVWNGLSSLRVAFSGRLIAIKGPATVIAVARRLPQMEFTIIGDGELRTELERQSPANVHFVGMLPFTEWPAYVRENVDVALLPHPQGDPSGTYHEMLGCGVPIVGLPNSSWKRLAASDGLGWTATTATGLASVLASLTPKDLENVRAAAFAILRPFEEIAAQRVSHLVEATHR